MNKKLTLIIITFLVVAMASFATTFFFKKQRKEKVIYYTFELDCLRESSDYRSKYIDFFCDSDGWIACSDDSPKNRLWFISDDNINFCYKIPYPEKHNVQNAKQHIVRNKSSFYLIDGLSSNLYSYSLGDTIFQFIDSINSNIGMQNNGLNVWPARSNDLKNTFIIGDSIIGFPCLPNYSGRGKYNKKTFGFPITGFYNLKNKKITFGKFLFPAIFQKNNFGLLSQYSQFYDGRGFIYYHSPASSSIIKYNIKTESSVIIDVKSDYHTKNIPTLKHKSSPKTKDSEWKHFMLSHRYEQLHISPDGSFFYRLFFHEMPEIKEDGKYSTFNDKRMSVILMDKNLIKINEIILPKYAFQVFTFATNDGFNCRYFPPENQDRKEIKMVKILNNSDK